MKAELILVILAVLINHIEAACVSTGTEYTKCKTAYDVVNKAGVTRTDYCAAAAAFITCVKVVDAACETNALTTIATDTTKLSLAVCDCDATLDAYKKCKTTYGTAKGTTRTTICAAAITFKSCAKELRSTCETTAQAIITTDTSGFTPANCDCDATLDAYKKCKTTYDTAKGATRTTMCAAATIFKTCAKAVFSTCETTAQTTTSADITASKFVGCAVTKCESTFVGYAGCKTIFDTVKSTADVTKTVFCAAAEAFKTCAQGILPDCEATAQSTITDETTKLKFTACGSAASISISLSLMVLTFVAVLKNYL